MAQCPSMPASSEMGYIYGGTSEIMKTIIARDVTGLRA
jgi:alkylation response protein AidB-like acyl-CoA dehydrogenase